MSAQLPKKKVVKPLSLKTNGEVVDSHYMPKGSAVWEAPGSRVDLCNPHFPFMNVHFSCLNLSNRLLKEKTWKVFQRILLYCLDTCSKNLVKSFSQVSLSATMPDNYLNRFIFPLYQTCLLRTVIILPLKYTGYRIQNKNVLISIYLGTIIYNTGWNLSGVSVYSVELW